MAINQNSQSPTKHKELANKLKKTNRGLLNKNNDLRGETCGHS